MRRYRKPPPPLDITTLPPAVAREIAEVRRVDDLNDRLNRQFDRWCLAHQTTFDAMIKCGAAERTYYAVAAAVQLVQVRYS